MNTDRSCGCKSYKFCFICKEKYDIVEEESIYETYKSKNAGVFCENCSGIHSGWDSNFSSDCSISQSFPGIKILRNFIGEEEEKSLLENLDSLPWDPSQSGRRKQNYGPKANFKKKKAKIGQFNGFPLFSKFVQDRFTQVSELAGYKPVEQCSIEYRSSTGSCIEPHIDDAWIWGERIVQLNCLSGSYLSLVKYKGSFLKYNLSDVLEFPKILSTEGNVLFNPFDSESLVKKPYEFTDTHSAPDFEVVRIPLPRRSLLIMHGESRYQWKHCVLREDITERRIVIAYREFTPPYCPNGYLYEQIGKDVLQKANIFW